MTIRWPRAVLRPQNASFDIAPRSLAAPSSVSGVGQVVSSDAGIWKATFSNVVIRDRQHVLAFRAIANLLEGRLGSILVPFCRAYQPVPGNADGLYEPVPHSDDSFFDDDTGYVGRVINVVTVGSMALRAVSGTVSVNYAGEIEPGQHFSVGERLYRVRSFKETVPATPAGTVTADAPFAGSSFSAVTPNVSRASRASYFDASGVLRWAEPNELRIDHAHATGQAALIEVAATNLLLWSEDFTNAWWGKTRSTIIENAIEALDGSQTASKLVANTENATHTLTKLHVAPANTTFTWSIHVKAAGMTEVALQLWAGGSGSYTALIDLAAGTIFQQANPGAGWSNGSVGIQPLRDGWYRVWQTVTNGPTDVNINSVVIMRKDGSSTFIGDGVSGVYIDAAQFEVGRQPTSYIKTEGAQATRAADVVSVPTSAFPLNEYEGAVYVECIHLSTPPAGTAGLAQLSGSGGNDILIRHGQVIGGADFWSRRNGVTQVDTGSFAITFGEPTKYAYGYKEDDFAFSQNGKPVFTDTAGQAPATLTNLVLASGNAAIRIKRLVYFPRRLSNVELQRMTSAPSLFTDPLTVDNLVMIANESTTIHADNNNHWLVRLNDGTELTYSYVEGPLSIPVEDLGYHTIDSYRVTLAKPLPATAQITFRPPLREAVPAGTNLEFDDPVCRMRLATDSEMDLPLDLGRFSFPTVNFVEDL